MVTAVRATTGPHGFRHPAMMAPLRSGGTIVPRRWGVDNYYSVAYWYQSEPHAPFPALPPVEQRLPRVYAVGGPGNGIAASAEH